MKGVIYKGGTGLCSYGLCDREAGKALTDSGFDVTNRSRMGATVVFCRDNLDKFLIDKPDSNFKLLFEYGGNDSDFHWDEVSANPEGKHSPLTSPEDFCRIYRDNIARAREAGAEVAVANLIPIDSVKYFKKISTGLNADAILSWLGDISMLYRWHEFYNSLVEKTAAECGCKLIDLRSTFLLSHNYQNLMSADGIHPTEEGHRLIRETIAAKLG